MLLEIKNNLIKRKCDKCGENVNENVKSRSHSFLFEYGEYENYITNPCKKCGTIEVYNLNIPIDDMEEIELEKEVFPYSEINQRHYIRQLIRLVREDFKGNK